MFGCDLMLDGYAGEDNRPLAPLKQQAFKFFHDKHELHGYTKQGYGWEYVIETVENNCKQLDNDGTFNSNEESQSACIDKLIELAFKKK